MAKVTNAIQILMRFPCPTGINSKTKTPPHASLILRQIVILIHDCLRHRMSGMGSYALGRDPHPSASSLPIDARLSFSAMATLE